MDKGTGIGLGVALFCILGASVVESGNVAILFALLNIPSAMIVFGGTIGTLMVAFPLDRVSKLGKVLGVAFRQETTSERDLVNLFVRLAERARREGLLALESDVEQVKDPFIRHGLQMVIDGLEPDTVEEILEIEIESMQARHMKGIDMFAKMGGYAPTMGVIGTVMGLVNVLSNLEDPSGLGESIAVAFIATLIGVGSANIAWLPIAGNLKGKDMAEVSERRLALSAILAIQAGDNPRIVAQKLRAHAGPEAEAAQAAEKATAGSVVPEAA